MPRGTARDASATVIINHGDGSTALLADGAPPPTSSAASIGSAPLTGASFASSVSNLANTILGAGMLGLPHAFATAGFLPGTAMLLIFGGFASLGLHLLAEAADRSGRPASFYGVAEAAVPGAGLAIDTAIGIKCFGVATSYLIVVGDSMPKAMRAFGADGHWLDRHIWTLAAAAAVAPLTYCRRVDALKFTSALALVYPGEAHTRDLADVRPIPLAHKSSARVDRCVLFVVLLVFLFAIRAAPIFESCDPSPPALPPALPPLPPLSPPKPPSMPPLPPVSPPCRLPPTLSASLLDVLRAVPIFVFSYTCHQNIISITNELRAPTRTRATGVIMTSVGFALAVYLLISFSGALLQRSASAVTPSNAPTIAPSPEHMYTRGARKRAWPARWRATMRPKSPPRCRAAPPQPCIALALSHSNDAVACASCAATAHRHGVVHRLPHLWSRRRQRRAAHLPELGARRRGTHCHLCRRHLLVPVTVAPLARVHPLPSGGRAPPMPQRPDRQLSQRDRARPRRGRRDFALLRRDDCMCDACRQRARMYCMRPARACFPPLFDHSSCAAAANGSAHAAWPTFHPRALTAHPHSAPMVPPQSWPRQQRSHWPWMTLASSSPSWAPPAPRSSLTFSPAGRTFSSAAAPQVRASAAWRCCRWCSVL